jgi:hypothetical protein
LIRDDGIFRLGHRFVRHRLDAVVVGAPVGDALLDGVGFEILGEGAVDEGRDLGVGGEAEGDELPDVELVEVGEVGGGQEGGEAKALFEADDAVLELDVVHSGSYDEDKECEGDDDPPEEEVVMFGPVVDGGVDGEQEIARKDGKDEEVHGWVKAAVAFIVLRRWHGWSFLGLSIAGDA